MEGQEQATSIAIDIVNAIRTNDMAAIKIALDEFEAFNIQYGIRGSLEALPFAELLESDNSEALGYFLDNCSVFMPNLEFAKLSRYFQKYKDNENVEQIIKDELKESKLFKNLQKAYFYELLYRLAINKKLYDVLNEIKDKMEG